MLKRKIFTVSLLWLSLTICLSLELSAYADNGCDGNIPTEPGNVDRTVCESSTIAWDDANSAATIARNLSCTVAITDTGNGGPYTWTVSGNGFTLVDSETDLKSKILRADGTACGSATIKVIGCDGKTEVTGYVRCTTGTWIFTQIDGSDCPWSGTKYPDHATGASASLVFGYKTYGKWYVSVMYARCKKKDAAPVACRSAWQLFDPLGGLEPSMANFIASGPCCVPYCNECITFTYFNARKPWPDVTGMNIYGPNPSSVAAAGIEGHAYIIGTYPDKCSQSYPYYSVSARLSFWKAYINVSEWRCP